MGNICRETKYAVGALLIIGAILCCALLYTGNSLCFRSKVSFAGKQAALFGLNCSYFNGVSRNADAAKVQASTQTAMQPVMDNAGIPNALLKFQMIGAPLRGQALVDVPSLQLLGADAPALGAGAPALGVVLPKNLTLSQESTAIASDFSLPYVVTIAFTKGSKPAYVVVPAAAAGAWQASGSPPAPWPGYLSSCAIGQYEPGYIFFVSDQECTECTLFHPPSW